MAFEHGVRVNEVPTGVRPPVRISAGLPVFTGTSPLVDETAVNKPIVCYTLAEFVEKFGALQSDFASWTLHEAAKAVFSVYGVAPAVFINVLDPDNEDHVAEVVTDPYTLDSDGSAILELYGTSTPTIGVLMSTVVVRYQGVVMTIDVDYTLDFDEDGQLVVTRVAGGDIPASALIHVSYSYLDPSGVTADDIIGGYSSGVYTGLEVVEQVYPALRLVPGFILAPGWSHEPTVAARMKAIAPSINGAFKAMALVDITPDIYDVPTYAEVPAWKADNGYTSEYQVACWPKVKNGDDVYHLSTVLACVANVTDAAHDGIPYASPSNKAVTGTAAVHSDDDATEVLLTRPQANSLNAQGVVTVLNGFNGWRIWGNYTGAYPDNTDPKDAFISIRRMFIWVGNIIILTTDRDVDEPGNRRLIDSVLGTIGSFLNSLKAVGALHDGSIQFLPEDNPTTDLAAGKVVFDVSLSPPSPAQDISFKLSYDPEALAGLFE